MPGFAGKVVLVTGGASGIGRSVALLFARAGARVVIADMDEDGGTGVVAQARGLGGEAAFTQVDVSRPLSCENMIGFVLEKFGRLDIACNNAAIGGEANLTADYSLEGWDAVIRTNLSSVFYCMRCEIPAMLKNKTGAIVNTASVLGQVGFASSPAYTAAKHGVIGLTRTAALEYARDGLRINAVGPSFIQTPMLDAWDQTPSIGRMLTSLHPMGRMGQPEEVAELIAWLCSEAASFVTGAFYPVDGGYLAR